MNGLTEDQIIPALFLLVVGCALVLVTLSVFAFAIYKAGLKRGVAPLVVSLSLLSAIALVGYLLAPDREDAGTLAGIGLGALAGALGTIYTRKDNDNESPSVQQDPRPNPPASEQRSEDISD